MKFDLTKGALGVARDDQGEAGMSQLYDSDILAWSEAQAALLRRLAARECISYDAPDWPNIIEEIESVGNEQVRAVESLLFQALVHDLKARCWPLSREVPHWRAEARVFRVQASLRFAPSMRQRLDLEKLYAKALRVLPETIDGQVPLVAPALCPSSLDDLLADP